jgi:hypothetical protein
MLAENKSVLFHDLVLLYTFTTAECCVALLLHIQVSGLNVGLSVSCLVFHGFHQSLQAISAIVPQLGKDNFKPL